MENISICLTFCAADAVEASVQVLESEQKQLMRSFSFKLCEDSLKQVIEHMPECVEGDCGDLIQGQNILQHQ